MMIEATTLRVSWWNNTETWTTREGENLKLADMDIEHRRAVIAYVHRQGESLRFRLVNEALLDVAFHDGGDMAHDSLENILHTVQTAPIAEVIDSLPLIKALRSLEPTVIVRVSSHRANQKLAYLIPERDALYRRDFSAGSFARIPEYRLHDAIQITGVTKARLQDDSAYAKTWRSGR